MESNNDILVFVLIISVVMLVYNFSEPIDGGFFQEVLCPVFEKKPKMITIIHHPRLNKGFIMLVSSEDALSIIQKSLNKADNEYTIESNGKDYFIVYENKYRMQKIFDFSISNYEMIKKQSGLKLMGPT
jgi:hypothetical protein